MRGIPRRRVRAPCGSTAGARAAQVSLVLYLNEGWTSAAGGELRLFDAAGGHRDIEPVAGRLVCFLTPGREHEVLPTQCARLSISGWFRARDCAV
jgi:SM-20-related protein